MAKLQLYLKGAFFTEAKIELPDFKQIVDDPIENFEFNCRLREEYVRYQTEAFRINHIRQLLKCNNEFEIILVMSSRIGEPNLIQDAIINF